MIRFRVIFPIMAGITVLMLLTPILLGVASAVLTYKGTCYGFTDGSWDCPWKEYLSDQIFWSVWLDVPLGIFLIVCWLVTLGLWFYKRRTDNPTALSLPQVILIPVGGSIGCFALLSIFSIFIRFSSGFLR